MALITNQEFLPGVITQVESDYNYGYDSSLFGSTDAVLVIGTAFNGPAGIPVEVYTPEHAKYVFGGAYDNATRTQATLVGAVQDAYDRGCRTIYAMRISGKTIYKDFQFSRDTSLRLRISAVYPSNEAKDYFMTYTDGDGLEAIKIYKPASRATIQEKMQGMIENMDSVVVNEILLNRDYGLTKSSSLEDVIRVVNDHRYNNVLRLAVIDENGVDVTLTSSEARDIMLGDLLPGAYMIGRNDSLCVATTHLDFRLIENDSEKPYPEFDDILYKVVTINSDVSSEFPIYADIDNEERLANIIAAIGVSTRGDFDFLETSGLVDRVFAKDKVDYEEVRLSNFEIYEKLGSGYAITARAERRTNALDEEIVPKVKETPASDTNRVAAIREGVYSMLENLPVKYRVLSMGEYDKEIGGRLPRPADFEIASPISYNVFNDLITITPVVQEDSKTDPKSFSIVIDELVDAQVSSIDTLYMDKTFKVLPRIDLADEDTKLLDANVDEGTYVMVVDDSSGSDIGTLKRYNDGVFHTVNDAQSFDGEVYIVNGKLMEGTQVLDNLEFHNVDTASFDYTGPEPTYLGKEYILVENNAKVYSFKVLGELDIPDVAPLGDIRTMLTQNKEKNIIYAQYNFFETNPIVVRSGTLEGTTLEEFVEMLNQHESLRREFNFSIAESALMYKDDYVVELADDTNGLGIVYPLAADKRFSYDYNKYIPYKTNDNFARQLAQHCTYTGLKTSPTHGFIGATIISDIGLASVANKVSEIASMEFEMFAKNQNGRNMLDRNNLPFPIGKNVSMVFTQYFVNMDDGYRFVSNGAAGYAGMVSTLPLHQSSTNQPFAILNTMFDLTNSQLVRLTQRGIVTIKQSFTRGSVITDGITMAPVESSFRRLSVSRVINSIEELIREAVEPYIGKQNHAANRDSMRTAIESRLQKVRGKLVEDYRFNMVVDPRILKFNYIDIDYQIVPIYEIREVRNRVTVKDQL